MSIVPPRESKAFGLSPSSGAQARGMQAGTATPSPPDPARGLSPGARLAPRAPHLAPRRPPWRAAASYSAGSGASRIQSSWASPWWVLALAGDSRSVADAGCGMLGTGRCGDTAHRLLSALPPPLGTEHSGFAWQARWAPPAAARCSATANQRGRGRSVPVGRRSWGDRVPLCSEWRLPTGGASDLLRSSLGTHSPDRLLGDSKWGCFSALGARPRRNTL